MFKADFAQGNCLFNALSDQLYGNQDMHEVLRTTTIEHMKDSADFYRQYMACNTVRRNPKRKTAAAAAGAGTGAGTNTSTSTDVVVHSAQAAISAANTFRLGTVRARTSGGENLDSMEAEWIAPWNNADVDMDVPNANPLGGVNLGQKTVRTQNAINELCKSWNDQMATTKVLPLPTYRQQNYAISSPSPRVSGGLRSRPRETLILVC